MLSDPYTISPPNIRSIIVPDPGFSLMEVDLAGADAQVVAWEANANDLKLLLQSGADLHSQNAYHLFNRNIAPRDLHLNGMTYRDNAKRAVHLTNYAGGYRTLATSCAVSEAAATDFISWWSRVEHPAIGEWHRRVEYDLRRRKYPVVRNVFGFRKLYTDRPDHLIGQALAWIAQSTVALVIDRAMRRVDCALDLVGQPRCTECICCRQPALLELLLQVHDSILVQAAEGREAEAAAELTAACAISCPYPDPLVISTEIKWSPRNWGSMQKWAA
jgi:DNA polymerase I-like protein with 3'-5' exonuclease and polymerase domains